jgi:hypothetical protein
VSAALASLGVTCSVPTTADAAVDRAGLDTSGVDVVGAVVDTTADCTGLDTSRVGVVGAVVDTAADCAGLDTSRVGVVDCDVREGTAPVTSRLPVRVGVALLLASELPSPPEQPAARRGIRIATLVTPTRARVRRRPAGAITHRR